MLPEDRISCLMKALMIHEGGGLVLTRSVGFQVMHEGKDLPSFDGGQRLNFLNNLGRSDV